MMRCYGPPSEVAIDGLKEKVMEGYFKREVERRRPIVVMLPSGLLAAIVSFLSWLAFGGSKAGDDDLTAAVCAGVVTLILAVLFSDLLCRSAVIKSATVKSVIYKEVIEYVKQTKEENLARLQNDATVAGHLMTQGGREGLLPLGPAMNMFGKLDEAVKDATKRWEDYAIKVRKGLGAVRS